MSRLTLLSLIQFYVIPMRLNQPFGTNIHYNEKVMNGKIGCWYHLIVRYAHTYRKSG
jgi:hypothetical protein